MTVFERSRRFWIAARLGQAFLAPSAVFIGSSYARFDVQPGPGLPAHIVVSVAALLAAAGVNLVDHAWNRSGAPALRQTLPDANRPLDAREAAIAGSIALLAAFVVGVALVPLSGATAVGFGIAAVVLAILRGVPLLGCDALDRRLGDLANVLAYGPLAVLAGFASQSGLGSTGAAIVGIPAGLAAGAVLYARPFSPGDAGRRHDRLGLVAQPVLAIVAAGVVVAAGEAPAGTLAAGVPLAVLAALAWRASRATPFDFDRYGRIAAPVAAAALIVFAVAFRLAVR